MKRAPVMVGLMAILVMACAVTYVGNITPSPTPLPTLTPSVAPTEKVRIDNIGTATNSISTIQAESVRVRSRPDAAGPTDSIELVILKRGDRFYPTRCETVNNAWWAFGEFDSHKYGWIAAIYLFPNPCK